MASSLLAIGAYTQKLPFVAGAAKGIAVVSLDHASGQLALKEIVEGGANPTFLCTDREKKFLYATNEHYGSDSVVQGFDIDPASGHLTPVNKSTSKGGACCYDIIDPSGKFLLSANYETGSVAVCARGADGVLGEEPVSFVEFPTGEASGAVPDRQERPHAHHVVFYPSNPEIVFVVDLGSDSVRVLRFNSSTGALTPAASIKAPNAGSGPRHLVAHPSLPLLYLVNELDNTVVVFAFDAATLTAQVQQTISTLPHGADQPSWCAAIILSSDSRHLYVSNRGHDSIAVFAVDPASGLLTFKEAVPVQGKCPRDIHIVGSWLVAANQNSHALATFKINSESGSLVFSGHTLELATPSAVCPISQ